MMIQMPSVAIRLVRNARTLIRVGRALGSDLYDLVRLEARLAASAAAGVAALGAAAATLVGTAWILLILALVAWIADKWLSWPVALLVVGVGLIVVAVPLVLRARRLTQHMAFVETRRRLEELTHG
jgi:hypothetical protein